MSTTEGTITPKWEDMYPVISNVVFGLDIICAVISVFGCIGNVFIMKIVSKWENISSGAALMFSVALADFLSVFYDGFIDQVGFPPTIN